MGFSNALKVPVKSISIEIKIIKHFTQKHNKFRIDRFIKKYIFSRIYVYLRPSSLYPPHPVILAFHAETSQAGVQGGRFEG